MGYNTYFTGEISIDPPLNPAEINYLTRFNHTRHCNRTTGPYAVSQLDDYSSPHTPDVIDYNEVGFGKPDMYCPWVPNDEGTALVWDEDEKPGEADEWMVYLIDVLLKTDAVCLQGYSEPGWVMPVEFTSFGGHVLNGVVEAQGEIAEDRWRMTVVDNVMTRQDATVQWPE